MTHPSPSKRCFKCDEEKPVDEFYRHGRMRDGKAGQIDAHGTRDMSDNPASELMVSNNGALMRLETYQQQALTTAVFPPDRGLEYLGCGLASEAGEVAGKIAKAFRGDRELDADAVISELGDVLWFVAVLSSYLGYTLDDVAAENLRKLAARSKAGTLKGDGDTR